MLLLLRSLSPPSDTLCIGWFVKRGRFPQPDHAPQIVVARRKLGLQKTTLER
jgi:hypothetical protein